MCHRLVGDVIATPTLKADLTNNLWWNQEHGWILSEVRVGSKIEVLDFTELRVVNGYTGEFVKEDIGEVWDYEWKLIK